MKASSGRALDWHRAAWGLSAVALGALLGIVAKRQARGEPQRVRPPCVPNTVVVERACPSAARAVEDVAVASRIEPPVPEPEALEGVGDEVIVAFEDCGAQGGHHVVVDCGAWPCMAGIVYASRDDHVAEVCRDRLPESLPTEVGMSVRDGAHYHWRIQYLAEASLIERWEDQAWRELAQARKELLLERLMASVGGVDEGR